jgi:putative SOS response-associated peptidase YedK
MVPPRLSKASRCPEKDLFRNEYQPFAQIKKYGIARTNQTGLLVEAGPERRKEPIHDRMPVILDEASWPLYFMRYS